MKPPVEVIEALRSRGFVVDKWMTVNQEDGSQTWVAYCYSIDDDRGKRSHYVVTAAAVTGQYVVEVLKSVGCFNVLLKTSSV